MNAFDVLINNSYWLSFDDLNAIFDSNPISIIYLTIILISILIFYYSYIVFTFDEIVKDMSDCKVNKSGIRCDNLNNDLPPYYPNGWIPILESRNLKVSQTKPIIALGYELVAFRGISGDVHVLDAFCPHLGANLGVGGRVVSERGRDCIRCPFHGWTFQAEDGMCVKIPGFSFSDSQLPNARIKVWDNKEMNGIIFVWYHSKGMKPEWMPIKMQQIYDSKWVYRGRTEHLVECHFQEIPENGADVVHLNELHKPGVMLGTALDKFPFYHRLSQIIYHEWQSKWWACPPPDQHIAMMTLENRNKLFGFNVLDLDFVIKQIGPACVHLEFKTCILGITGAFIQMITPLAPNKHKIVHHVYTDPTFKGRLFSKFLLYGEARMIERDIVIWNNKRLLKNPIFTKNEKSLVRFRRWFSQFYSEPYHEQKEW